MKKTITIFILILINIQQGFAFSIKNDTVVVQRNDSQILQVIVTIDNTDSEPLWIWFDCQDYGGDDRNSIVSYLMKRKGDFSIYDIATDSNMIGQWWQPSAPMECFVKYLSPSNTFTIILYREMISNVDFDKNKICVSEIIKIYYNRQVQGICTGIDEPYCIGRISFPYNVIVVPIVALISN